MVQQGKKTDLRVLVYGGRDFSEREALHAALDRLHRLRRVAAVIEGEARGADRLAREWAEKNGVPVLPFPADWNRFGLGAGRRRNTQMLVEGKPDVGVEFPGGRGTADMRKQLDRARIPVWTPYEKITCAHCRHTKNRHPSGKCMVAALGQICSCPGYVADAVAI